VRDAFARAGVGLDVVRTASLTVDGGVAALDAVLDDGRPCDAVVAWNDVVALGVLEGCRRRGVGVPADVRVLGIDGLPLGTWVTPRLSSLAVDMTAVAGAALDLAIGLHDGSLARSGPDAVRRVAHRFVRRDST